MNGRLYRSRDERVLAGVAGGLADSLDVDPSLVRVIWVILALFSGGAFLVVYIVMALVVPEEPWVPLASPTGAPAAATTSPLGDPPGAASGSSESATAAGGSAAAGGNAPPTQASAWQAQGQDYRTVRQEWQEQRDAWRGQRRAERAARRAAGEPGGGQAAGLVFGLILLAIGVVFLLPLVVPAFDVSRWWPLILVGIGLVLVIAAVRPGRPQS
jgi:phage shock protein C